MTDKATLQIEHDGWSAHWRAASEAVYPSIDEALQNAITSLDIDTTDHTLTHCGKELPGGSLLLHMTVYTTGGHPQFEPIYFALWQDRPGIVATCIGTSTSCDSHRSEDYETAKWRVFSSWVLRVAE